MNPFRILVIDDEPSICSGCRIALEEAGLEVDTCATGGEGLAAILSGR